jgi:hypothetical protein
MSLHQLSLHRDAFAQYEAISGLETFANSTQVIPELAKLLAKDGIC